MTQDQDLLDNAAPAAKKETRPKTTTRSRKKTDETAPEKTVKKEPAEKTSTRKPRAKKATPEETQTDTPVAEATPKSGTTSAKRTTKASSSAAATKKSAKETSPEATSAANDIAKAVKTPRKKAVTPETAEVETPSSPKRTTTSKKAASTKKSTAVSQEVTGATANDTAVSQADTANPVVPLSSKASPRSRAAEKATEAPVSTRSKAPRKAAADKTDKADKKDIADIPTQPLTEAAPFMAGTADISTGIPADISGGTQPRLPRSMENSTGYSRPGFSGQTHAQARSQAGRNSRNTSARGRNAAPRKNRNSKGLSNPDQSTLSFQPEAFADIYPTAAEAILPFVLQAPVSVPELDDDGPQPTLPDQPSLVAVVTELEEDELAALDEQINGNRVVEENRGLQRKGRDKGKKLPRQPKGYNKGSHTSSNIPPAPLAITDDLAETEPEEMLAEPGKQYKGKSTRQEKASPEPKQVKPVENTTKRVLYVSEVPGEQVEVVITDDGVVSEYFVEMAHQAKIRGNIYKGVINNVDTNLQAAFVNFGGHKNGFLQIDEIHPEYWLTHHDSRRGPKYPPIQKVLKVGQEVLVQVVKEPSGSKGAFLTTWLSLAGRFLVLTPGQEQIGVSRKVEDPKERNRLRELLAGIQPGENMGVIIRTASEGATKSSIQKDLQFLKRMWRDMIKRAVAEKSPALLHEEADLASRAVRDYLAENIFEIWVDYPSTLNSIQETTGLLYPRRKDMVKLHDNPKQSLWERFGLQKQLGEVTSREVVLPSGGRLVFDQTEALMAIDINSGKTQGKSNFEEMVFRTNMEATEAIARHLRLRDIGGQVVIDFIEMRDRGHCREVEKAMRNAMRTDRARHDVGRMSSFGLLELVRQRTGTSAISISSEPCPHCRGTGVRRNMEWQALQALRDLQSKLAKTDNKNKKEKNNTGQPVTFLFETDHELGMYILNKKRDRLIELETKFSLHIEIVAK